MLQAMQQHIASTMHQYKHQSMATTIWALAKLSNKGSTTTDPAAAGSIGTTSSTSGAATGSGSTSSTVSSELVAALVEGCQHQLHLWSPRDLSQAAWGLAKLGAKPSEQWCQVRGSDDAACCGHCHVAVVNASFITYSDNAAHCHLAHLVGDKQQFICNIMFHKLQATGILKQSRTGFALM
jgi:hypothetical protein